MVSTMSPPLPPGSAMTTPLPRRSLPRVFAVRAVAGTLARTWTTEARISSALEGAAAVAMRGPTRARPQAIARARTTATGRQRERIAAPMARFRLALSAGCGDTIGALGHHRLAGAVAGGAGGAGL